MKWIKRALWVLLAVAVLAMLYGCTRDDRPCLAAHDEEYTYLEPILISFTNGIPQYMYIPQTGVTTLCDRYGESATRFADGTLKK